ncbi:EscU/YscU/HrcU family type III secretion system export apparatus switch protein [Bacillus sp. ISL-47]|uniref:EscU/YscU/HrcU family type III secretion system export apparatus switch protein n=1 Tax=Bacillus sp. ISL-47 TaxID=2819130 RepID=UPI001BE86336|nr:EscU/YscU/HrcU family type III secretion system export apparatus switch protein [Bacillus sp. ISL-47]MBT2688541.1 EscU/YscU/HrcU family type III secretion system export apparatus switch protein [Bacillus sp. ISL-47]MBT2708839.1 EscU/YscU/HrcU family type III secretion system export apparatus switch protein [Pseudomonas sp. ISL-84]
MKKENNSLRKEAVALTYDPQGHAPPQVSAKGRGVVAENILAKAKAHNVPVQEDSTLVELLGKLDINEGIPEELFQAVAEVFAFIYRADQEAGKKHAGK